MMMMMMIMIIIIIIIIINEQLCQTEYMFNFILLMNS